MSDASATGSDPRPTVYVETSVISYLVARPSADLVARAHQKTTRDWWTERARFRLYASSFVADEAKQGDPAYAAQRLGVVATLLVLAVPEDVDRVAQALLLRGSLPRKAETDALHVAVAAVNGVDYLVTWNLRHIANPAMRRRIEEVCRNCGYEPPILCTPEELLEAVR